MLTVAAIGFDTQACLQQLTPQTTIIGRIPRPKHDRTSSAYGVTPPFPRPILNTPKFSHTKEIFVPSPPPAENNPFFPPVVGLSRL